MSGSALPIPHRPGTSRVHFGPNQIVRLTRAVTTPAGIVPKGTIGTVLLPLGDDMYQIELEGPYDVPETISVAALEAAIARPA